MCRGVGPLAVELILYVAGPVLAAWIVLLLAWRPWRRSIRAPDRDWATGPALATGFLIAFIAQVGWSWTESPARWHLLAVLALAATLIGAVAGCFPGGGWTVAGWGALAGVCGASLTGMPGVDSWAMRAGLGVSILLLTVIYEPLGRRRPISTLLVLMVALATLVGLLLISHFAKLALITCTFAATCAFAAILTAWNHRVDGIVGGVVVCSALIPAIALTGYAYDYQTVPVMSWILVVVATAAAWLAEVPVIKRAPRWLSGSVSVAAVAIPCTVALLWTLSASDAAY